MDIDHLHLYVDDASSKRRWFETCLGFESVGGHRDGDTQTEWVCSGALWVAISSPIRAQSPVADYLQRHPSGIADVAFQVADAEAVVSRAVQAGAHLTQPLQTVSTATGQITWAQIQGWGDLCHTVVQRSGVAPIWPQVPCDWRKDALQNRICVARDKPMPPQHSPLPWLGFDHAVLNVPEGELWSAVAWYERHLGFLRQQSFAIATTHSALTSQVLMHPDGPAQLPINEPASPNSQIQEFLNYNRGSGIQHVALRTEDILSTVSYLRQQGLRFLSVPITYYQDLVQRSGFAHHPLDWAAIAACEILVDWPPATPEAVLLQTFTEPIFAEPTVFLEIIERRHYLEQGVIKQACGFGEGNFQALFEALEREQAKRGNL